MQIEKHTRNDVCVISPRGRLDAATAPGFRDRMAAITGTDRMVIDMERVDFIDSSGLGALVAAVRGRRQSAGDLKLACLNRDVRRVFELTRAFRLFDIFDSPDAAAKSFAREERT
jgi:anti-sigma B factor antagonist